ncbi:MAG: SLBB domain-containing protein, partial [Aeoliella sp.]
PSRLSNWLRRMVFVMFVLTAGCRSAHYRAQSLPQELLAPAARGATSMNLARLSGAAGGTSELVAGDLLHLTLLSGIEEGEIVPKPARVADDGSINVPLVGVVNVTGLDEQQAAEQIRAASIERGIYRNPQVTVKVAQRAVNYVTVLGAVAEPGTHPLPRGASNMVAAIAAAGGFTDEAGTEVEVLRQPPRYMADNTEQSVSPVQLASFTPPPLAQPAARTERIDLAMASAGARSDLRLGDQDVVMVHPADKRVIHVAGLVRQPNQFEMPKDQALHVLDAIAMAGGKSSPVADKVYVIRRIDEKAEPKLIQLSLSKAKTDGVENLRLAPGDMVSVEATIVTGVVDTLSNVFRITAGVGGNLLSF